jgi:hypothetical protein
MPAMDTNLNQMNHLAVDALASHYHRYAKWTVKSGVPNVHGNISTLYSGMLTKDDLDRVDRTNVQ